MRTSVAETDVLRLLLLFQFRYEGREEESIARLRAAFPQHAPMMDAVIAACGARRRGPDDVLAAKTGLVQFFSDIRALREANPKALDQFRPLLASIVDRVKKGTLDPTVYPFSALNGHFMEMRCSGLRSVIPSARPTSLSIRNQF
jgi:hypothetical protein